MLKAFLAAVIISICVGFYYYNTNTYYDGPKSDHFDGWKFHNPGKPQTKKFFDFLKWRWEAKRPEWPDHVENKYDAIVPQRVDGDTMLVTYIGHASFLVQTNGTNIITDPIFSERASPVSWAGPKRVHNPGIQWDNLPKIDVVIISHNHYDHMDLPTLKKLYERDNPIIIVPIGNEKTVSSIGADINLHSLDWGGSIGINKIKVHVDQAHHWSARGILDRNKALWAAYTIETPDGNIYFAGDTGYGEGDHFRFSKDKHGSYRLALLPIGAYEPRWFMKYSHMNPPEAVMAYKDLGNPYTIGMHFDVFKLTDEDYGVAVPFLESEKEKENADKFKILEVGQSWEVPLV